MAVAHREESGFLSEQLRVFEELIRGRRRIWLNDDQRRRLAVRGQRIGRWTLREMVTIVTPDTILRWHRELIARKFDNRNGRRSGHPRIVDEIQELVVLMATDYERWGFARIVGELSKRGHSVSRSSVRRILNQRGNRPTPVQLGHMLRSKFL